MLMFCCDRIMTSMNCCRRGRSFWRLDRTRKFRRFRILGGWRCPLINSIKTRDSTEPMARYRSVRICIIQTCLRHFAGLSRSNVLVIGFLLSSPLKVSPPLFVISLQLHYFVYEYDIVLQIVDFMRYVFALLNNIGISLHTKTHFRLPETADNGRSR